MVIAVIDGMGGGIGAEIVAQLRQELPLEVEILALGTDAIATQQMMKARANRGASCSQFYAGRGHSDLHYTHCHSVIEQYSMSAPGLAGQVDPTRFKH